MKFRWVLHSGAYSHWPDPRKGEGSGRNGLYETVWKLSHYTCSGSEPEHVPRPIVPHCSGASPFSCLGPGSTLCKYTIMQIHRRRVHVFLLPSFRKCFDVVLCRLGVSARYETLIVRFHIIELSHKPSKK